LQELLSLKTQNNSVLAKVFFASIQSKGKEDIFCGCGWVEKLALDLHDLFNLFNDHSLLVSVSNMG